MRLVDADYHVRLRLHITEHNCQHMLKLIRDIASTFGHDVRWSVHIKPVERLGGKADSRFGFLKNYQVVDDLENYAQSQGLSVVKRQETVCYAAAANSFVIRADGRIGKCTVAFNDPRNDVGVITSTGLSINMEKLIPWIRPVLERDAIGAKCPLVKLRY